MAILISIALVILTNRAWSGRPNQNNKMNSCEANFWCHSNTIPLEYRQVNKRAIWKGAEGEADKAGIQDMAKELCLRGCNCGGLVA